MENQSKVFHLIMDMGELLLQSGAEVNRVEDTVRRMGAAYGFQRVDVFSITSSIMASAHGDGGTVYSQNRRVLHYANDMNKIEKINYLSRRACRNPLAEEALEEEIQKIRALKSYKEWIQFLNYGLVAGSFTVFFRGTAMDGLVSFLCGLILRLVLRLGRRLGLKTIVLNFFTSVVVGVSTVGFMAVGLGDQLDQIIIGNIMLLIPGVLLTTSLRDMINGDLVTGIMGLGDAILRSLAISFGFALAMTWIGGGWM